MVGKVATSNDPHVSGFNSVKAVSKAVSSRLHSRQDLYWVLLLSLLMCSVVSYGFYEFAIFRAFAAERPDYHWPSWLDLIPTFVASLATILVVRSALAHWLFRPLGYYLIEGRKKYTKDEVESRVERLCGCSFKLLYFLVTTAVGWHMMKDKEWFPYQLGGSGNVLNVWAEWPFVNHSRGMVGYYAWQFAYHVHSIIYQLYLSNRRDFFEMMLHHSATVILIGFSYNENFLRIGCLIMFLHDIPDITIYLCKVCNEIAGDVATLVTWANMVVVFAYFRLYVLPFVLIYSVYYELPVAVPPQYYVASLPTFYTFSLSCLVMLHCFWWYLFWKMIYETITKKQVAYDCVDQVVHKPAEEINDKTEGSKEVTRRRGAHQI